MSTRKTDEAIVTAITKAIAKHKADKIKDKPVGSVGPWHSKLWSFTKSIKTTCKPGSDAEVVFKMVNQAVMASGGWDEIVPGMGPQEIYAEFINSWNDIKFRDGESYLDWAYAKAKQTPLRHEKYTGNSNKAGYAEFISLAGWLQVVRGDRDIMLPLKQVAEILGISTRMVTNYLRWAGTKKGEDGFLIPIDLDVRPGKAAKYRFATIQFPELEKAKADQ